MSQSHQPTILCDIAQRQADINRLLGAGSTFGEIGERVAAEITAAERFRGTGRDLRVPNGLTGARQVATGLEAPGPRLVPYTKIVPTLPKRDQDRYNSWQASADLLGEVKARQILDGHILVDTRKAGPADSFFPFVDFYVVILFDEKGRIVMARRLALDEMIDYVASDVGRGGAWNYKVSLSLTMSHGVDLTAAAQLALRTLAV